MVALETATQVLLVTQLDLPCLRNVVRLMMSFGEINGLKDKVKIVVNRVGLDATQISMKKAQETIGREIFWQLPNDYRTMSEVRNNGVPLIEHAPKAAITQTIVELADHFSSSGQPRRQAASEGEELAKPGKNLALEEPVRREKVTLAGNWASIQGFLFGRICRPRLSPLLSYGFPGPSRPLAVR